MKLEYIFSLFTVILFCLCIVFSKTPRRFYILFILYSLPFIDFHVTPAAFGDLRVFDGISYIISIILIKDLFSIKRQFRIYYILFFCLLLILFFGIFNSDFISSSLFGLLSVFPIFIYSKLLINECFIDDEFQRKVIFALKLIAIISVVFLLIQINVGLKFTIYSQLNRNTLDYRGIRYPSFFHDPQKYEEYLAILSFLFLINYENIKKPTFINYIFFSIAVIAMLATGGRSAFLGLLAGMAFLFVFLGKRYRIILFYICFISAVFVINFSDSLLILKRSETFGDDYLIRASLWDEASQIFINHPIFGIGIGSYLQYSIHFSHNFFIDKDNVPVFFDQPESGYWKILTEIGALGAFISLLFISMPIVRSIKSYFNGNSSLITSLFIAGILSWLVSFVSVYSLDDRRILVPIITLICFLITSNTRTEYDI
jgi:hypothetical protein